MKDEKPDNPNAFPENEGISDNLYPGMTLRDYFAAKAIAGSCSEFWNFKRDDDSFNSLAESAYKIADAMLKERNKE